MVSNDPANALGNNEYLVMVTATSTDPNDGSLVATIYQTIVVTVINVNEPPGRPGDVAATPATNNGHETLEVTWTAASTTGRPPVLDYDVHFREQGQSNWRDANYDGTAVSTSIEDLDPSTTYEVRVVARNEEGDGPWSETAIDITSMANQRWALLHQQQYLPCRRKLDNRRYRGQPQTTILRTG